MPARSHDIDLEELARLVNVWAEHNLVPTTVTALSPWALQTAARSPRLPRPDVGLPLLVRLELATQSRRDALQPSPRLLDADCKGALRIDRFSSGMALCLFEQMLGVPFFAEPISRVLPYVQLDRLQLRISWKDVPRKDRDNRGWLWLQQLGLMVHDGSTVVFDPSLLPYVIDAPPSHRRVSQAELDERLELQKVRAGLAEDHVVKLEKTRLRAAGVGHLADDVTRISIDDVTAGYDVLSFEANGDPRYIEVKSSAGPRQFFVLTRNEYEVARAKGGSYWLAWVGWAARLPAGRCDVAWFRDPTAVLEDTPSPWEVVEGDLIVRRRTSDDVYQTQP